MYGREDLEEIPMIGWECYDKEEADKVMDAMETRIKELESIPHTDNTAVIEALQNRIKELEERAADAEKRAEKMLHNYEWAQSTIKELEAEVEMDAKKRRIMVNGYNKKCERVKELEAEIEQLKDKMSGADPQAIRNRVLKK